MYMYECHVGVTTYTHAQKLPPRQLVTVNSASNVLYCIYLQCCTLLSYYVFGATWPVIMVSEVDDAMTEDSSVNVVSYPDPSFRSSGWITSPLRATFRVAVM